MSITWHVEIDWDADGTYTDESARLLELSVRRGRETGLDGDGYAMVDPGAFSLLLDNWDQRYNPFNTGGALYGYIKPHRPFRLRATYAGVTYNVIAGWVRDIRPQENRSLVRITGYDGIDWLKAQNVPQLDLQTDYAVTDAIVALLTAAGWPFVDTSGWVLGTSQLGIDTQLGSSVIEDAGDELPYWWGDPEKSIWQGICDLGRAFAGYPYVGADGVFAYKARGAASVAAMSVSQEELLRDIELLQPWDELRNDVRITGWPRQATAANTELWKLNYIPLIGAGETLTIWAEHNYEGDPCPASSITTPASTTDYTANTAEDGGGTDKTAQIAITPTVYATRTKLQITNNDAGAVYLTLIRLRGTGLYAYSPVTAQESDSSSVSEYGRQTFRLGSPWLQKTDDINNHAEFAKSIFADPRKILFVRLVERPDYQLAPELFERVDVSIPHLEIDDDYQVTLIDHQWQAGRGLTTTMRMEPAGASGWALGVSELGISTVLGW